MTTENSEIAITENSEIAITESAESDDHGERRERIRQRGAGKIRGGGRWICKQINRFGPKTRSPLVTVQLV